MNTTRRLWLTSLDRSRGRIAHRQMAGLPARFARMGAAAPRVAVAHHPFLAPTDGPAPPRVGRADAALDAFAAAGIGLVPTAHLRQSAIGRHGAGGPFVLQVATGTATRLRDERHAFNRVPLDGGRLIPTVFRPRADGGFAPS